MLTSQDISNTLETMRGEPSPPLEVQKAYGGSVNEVHYFFCGLKKDYRNAAHFWITCEAYMRYVDASESPANSDPITGHHFLQVGDVFDGIVSIPFSGRQISFEALPLERFSSELVREATYLNGLGKQVDYHIEGEILQAVLDKDAFYIGDSAFAETTTQYIALMWYSTD